MHVLLDIAVVIWHGMKNVKSCESSAPQHAFKHAEFKWVRRPKDGEDDAFPSAGTHKEHYIWDI